RRHSLRHRSGLALRNLSLRARRKQQHQAERAEPEQRALVLQQPPFAIDAAAESREISVRADHAMTRHDDRNRVLAVGRANGARIPGVAELARELPVAGRAAVGDLAQQGPYAALELGSVSIERQIEADSGALEILRQLLRRPLENLV